MNYHKEVKIIIAYAIGGLVLGLFGAPFLYYLIGTIVIKYREHKITKQCMRARQAHNKQIKEMQKEYNKLRRELHKKVNKIRKIVDVEREATA